MSRNPGRCDAKKADSRRVLGGISQLLLPCAGLVFGLFEPAGRAWGSEVERLGRGLAVVRLPEDRAFLSWRLLASDPPNAAFDVFRSDAGAPPTKRNQAPIRLATCFTDGDLPKGPPPAYTVRLSGTDALANDARPTITLPDPAAPYLSIPLKTLADHQPGDASVGDLDGDSEYELVLKQEMHPRDNSQRGTTGQTKLEAYRLDGTLLWRIDLGRNIREGAHYTQFLVYDFDSDGKAEVVCKTADGTIDGLGIAIGRPEADHRNAAGYVLEGPEYLTVFEGLTGKALATADYLPPRGDVAAWGDSYGNRVDRFLACVACLDGKHPSIIMCRGYYTRTVLAAWDWREGRLLNRWVFDSDAGASGNRAYRGQGNHNLRVGDIDGDGKDEIVYGACAIDDDGKGLHSTGLGHGDAIHLSDLDPDRPGLEVFDIHEKPKHPHGAELRDALSGKILWSKPSPDVGRGLAADIDPRHRGCESWASGQGLIGLWDVHGNVISERKPRSCNFALWWDGDLLRELLDRNRITKWNWQEETETTLLEAKGCLSNNGTKATPCLSADLFGDWREEVVFRTGDNRALRIYTTTIPTEHRFITLMQDRTYRLSVANENIGYNQPPLPGFYLGEGMSGQ